MMLNTAMLRRGIRRLLAGKAVDLHAVADDAQTLCAAETAPTSPAIYLPGSVERIVRLSPWRDWDTELALIEGRDARHAPCTAYRLRDVELVAGFVYAGAAKSRRGWGPERLLYNGLGPRHEIDDAHLVTNFSGSHFFGNLLLDDFPLALLPPKDARTIAMTTRPYAHHAAYRDLCGLPPTETVERARIRELVVYTDYAQNTSKLARYRMLRERLRQQVARECTTVPAGIYIRRGTAGEQRVLVNESAIEKLLSEAGFGIIDPDTHDAETISRLALDAPVVVAVEGSQLSHAIYSAADDAAFVVLQPPERFAMAYKEFTDRMSMRFAFIVGDVAAGGFTIRPDELQRILDLVA